LLKKQDEDKSKITHGNENMDSYLSIHYTVSFSTWRTNFHLSTLSTNVSFDYHARSMGCICGSSIGRSVGKKSFWKQEQLIQ
jgi:hypothetical protein